MSNIFFASDHHFHHSNILNFKDATTGKPLRVFDSMHHMNEHMVNQHNKVVKPNDKVYFLGDVTMTRNAAGLEILARMNGEKILVRGNHDLCTAKQYLEYFKDVRGVHQFDGMILSHIPIHPDSLSRWGVNVHGHLHSNVVRLSNNHPDPRYYCVCMEQLHDYTPVSLEQVKQKVKSVLESMSK